MRQSRLIAAAVAAAFAAPLAAQTPSTQTGSAESSGAASAGVTAQPGAAMFRELDKNKDGFISREEAKGSPHESQFDKLDKDGDGKLSNSEHAAAHAAGKDSAATGGSSASGAPKSESK
jgi:hypothetical protein